MAEPGPGVLSDEHVGRRVISGSAVRVVGFFAANLLTLVAAVILLRYLGVRDFGRYGTVLALVGVVYGIADAGLTAIGTRELALCRTDEDRRDLLAHIISMRIALAGAGVVCAVGFALLAGYDSQMVLGTALAGVGTLLTSVQSSMLMPLSVELRNGAIALNEVVRQGVLVLSFIVLATAGASLVAFLAAQIAVGLVALAVTPLLLERRHLTRPRWTASRVLELSRVALPAAIATVLGVLYLRMLVVLMSVLDANEAEVGYFVSSTRVLEVAGGIPFLVIAVVLPVLSVAARDDHARLVYMTSQISYVMALAGIVVALGLWTLAEPILVTLGGAEYAPAAPVLQIQAFALITIFLTAAWQPAVLGMGRLRALAMAMGFGVACLLGSGLVLIPAFEAQGAAVAAVIGDVALCSAMFLALSRSGPGPWVHPGVLARITAATLAAVAVGLIPGVPDLLRAVLVLAVFSGAALAAKVVPSELFDQARAVAARRR